MAPTGEGFLTFNSQLVSFVYSSIPIRPNTAEFTPEDAFTLYHLFQEETDSKKSYGGPALPALGHATAGAIASAVSKALVYPIDTITTRLQVQKSLKGEKETDSAAADANAEYKDPIDAARKIYKAEGGIGAFYTGLGSDIAKGITDSFLFFFAYTMIRQRMLKSQGGKQLPVLKELSVGIIAGAFSKAITSPIQNIVTRQQTAALIAARNPMSSTDLAQSDKLSVKDIALQIRSEKGLAGFWAGYNATLILTLNPAITFAADNALKSLIPQRYRDNPSATQTFLVAALSKVLATMVTYPVTLAKSRAQAAKGPTTQGVNSSSSSPKASADASTTQDRLKHTTRYLARLFEGHAALIRSLRVIYRQEGLSGLYAGLEGEIVKGFLQHGLTMTAKDTIHGGVIQLYYLLLRLTRRWPEEFEKAQTEVTHVAQNVAEEVKHFGSKIAGYEK